MNTNEQPKKQKKRTIQVGLGVRSRQRTKPQDFYSYEHCKQIVRQFNFRTQTEFVKWIQTNYEQYPSIPVAPHHYYLKHGEPFTWEDFLGEVFEKNIEKYRRGLNADYFDYGEFEKTVREFKITSKRMYDELKANDKLPKGCPVRPDSVYKKTWKGWVNLTGYDARGKSGARRIHQSAVSDEQDAIIKKTVLQLLPFPLFKQEVRKQCFSFKSQYFDWVRDNQLSSKGFSLTPDTYYIKLGVWTDWYDVLGANNPNATTFAPKCGYLEAKKFVQSLNLRSIEEWRAWCKEYPSVRPDVSRYPDGYFSEWEGWDIFLGKHISEIVQTQKKNTSVLWIASTTNKVNNVFEISIDTNGVSSAYEDILITKEYDIVAMFEYEEQVINNIPLETIIKNIISNHTTGHFQRWFGGMHINYEGVMIDNICALIYDLTEFLIQLPIMIPDHIKIIKQKYEQGNQHTKSLTSGQNGDFGVEDLL